MFLTRRPRLPLSLDAQMAAALSRSHLPPTVLGRPAADLPKAALQLSLKPPMWTLPAKKVAALVVSPLHRALRLRDAASPPKALMHRRKRSSLRRVARMGAARLRSRPRPTPSVQLAARTSPRPAAIHPAWTVWPCAPATAAPNVAARRRTASRAASTYSPSVSATPLGLRCSSVCVVT